MSDLTQDRIRHIGILAKMIDEGDGVHLDAAFFHDVFEMSAELNARRQLAEERKAFWARRTSHETPSDCSGTA